MKCLKTIRFDVGIYKYIFSTLNHARTLIKSVLDYKVYGVNFYRYLNCSVLLLIKNKKKKKTLHLILIFSCLNVFL